MVFLLAGLEEPVCAQTGQIDRPQTVTWRRLSRNVCQDQKGIWLSPFRARRQDAKWWVLFGSATGALIATDKWTSKQLPNTRDQIRVSGIVSRSGAAYSLIPGVVAFYAAGAIRHDDRLRETGLLGAEALANGFVVSTVFKVATERQRPLEGEGSGRFWTRSGRFWNTGASFPSGHSTQVWAVASVVAHQYPRPRVIPVVAYGVATAVMASRFTARKHFASDVVAGAAIGWFIGNYVFHKRHRRPLDSPRSKSGEVVSHAGFGRQASGH
ncbi:MAG: phosphatase PAP2 family protein [Acidobacteria bacterium]|nr:phosphatase PAP2 family protein [Acidobacteriota bacterium]